MALLGKYQLDAGFFGLFCELVESEFLGWLLYHIANKSCLCYTFLMLYLGMNLGEIEKKGKGKGREGRGRGGNNNFLSIVTSDSVFQFLSFWV